MIIPGRRQCARWSLTALAFLVVSGGFAASCFGASPASKTAARVMPSQIVVHPNVAGPLCTGGLGVRLPAQLVQTPLLSSVTMADASTLIALSAGYPASRTAVLVSVTPRCTLERQFGEGGLATMALPTDMLAAHALPGFSAGLMVDAVAARNGGGAILAGSNGENWLVAEVTADGRLDSTFGDHGWAVLPFRGEVTAAVQEPSGRIIIGGDNGGAGCCTVNWAAALSPTGQLDQGFGARGRAALPTGEDSGVNALAVEPNGDLLAQVVYGNMGCWGVALAMLEPSGQPVPLFATRLGRFWQRLGFQVGSSAFVGDAFIDGDGFTLVGTGQRACASGGPSKPVSATGLIARFQVGGQLATPLIRFASPLLEVQALSAGTETVVVTWPYSNSTALVVTARRPDGSADRSFGSDGSARILTPWKGSDAAYETFVSITPASGAAMVVAAVRGGGNELQVVRLRI